MKGMWMRFQAALRRGGQRRRPSQAPRQVRPAVEPLEGRLTPAAFFYRSALGNLGLALDSGESLTIAEHERILDAISAHAQEEPVGRALRGIIVDPGRSHQLRLVAMRAYSSQWRPWDIELLLFLCDDADRDVAGEAAAGLGRLIESDSSLVPWLATHPALARPHVAAIASRLIDSRIRICLPGAGDAGE